MRIKISTLSTLPFLAGVLFLVLGSPAFSEDAIDPFGWQEIPPSALLQPDTLVQRDSFQIVDRFDHGITVAFNHPPLGKENPDIRNRFQFMLVTPEGGVGNATMEAGPPVYYMNDEVVVPDVAPQPVSVTKRVFTKELGEIRGVKLFLVEYLPLAIVRGSTQANKVWIPQATLSIPFRSPLNDPVEVSPLLQEGIDAVALNSSDFSRCLGQESEDVWYDQDRAAVWADPTLKIRTSDEGWTSIPGRRLLSEWGRNLEVQQVSIQSRGALIQVPSKWKESADDLSLKDRPVPLLILSATGSIKVEGRIAPSDTLVFDAKASDFWNDPLNCYWLTLHTHHQQDPAKPETESQRRTAQNLQSFARRTEIIGEDNTFLRGGLMNEQQEFFWVDRPFPGTESVIFPIGLPDWVSQSEGHVQANIRLIFPSSIRDDYRAAGSIRPVDYSVHIGGATLTSSLTGASSRYGQEVKFRIPPRIEDATIEIHFNPSRKLSSPPYFDRMILEGTQEVVWRGLQESYSFPVPTSGQLEIPCIGKGKEILPNTLFGLSKDGEIVHSSWKKTEDRIVCQITDSITSLHLLTGNDWKAPVSIEKRTLPQWLDSPVHVDQIVITPRVFRNECQEIVRLTEVDGNSAYLLDIEDIYDVFSGGRFSAHALRNFLVWISKTWSHPQPISVLVVGDSSWDFWGRFEESDKVPNWTPSYHTHRNPDYPTDLWFVEGQPQDRIADWYFGRIPCQTVGHLQGYIAKRRAFDAESTEEWSRRLLWISDDNDPVERNVQEIIGKVYPLSYHLDSIFLHDYPYVDNFYYGDNLPRIQEEAREAPKPLDFGKISPAANSAILDGLTEGAAVAVYYGHSGLNVLGHERVLFGGGSKNSDIPQLNNEGRTPLFFLMTCDVGRFDYTHERLWKWSYGLAEELLMHPFGGSTALVTSTGRGLPSDHLVLLTSCLDALLYRGAVHAGSMLWAGKVFSLIPARPNEGIEMFTLLGDPLFVPPIPSRLDLIIPQQIRWNETGVLEVEAEIDSESGARITEIWSVAPETMKEREGLDWTQSQDGSLVSINIPNAYSLEQVWLGFRYAIPEDGTGETKSQNSQLVLDLTETETPDWRELEPEGKPNLTISSSDISFENYSPKSGESQFISVKVHNAGNGVAWDIEVSPKVEGEDEPLLNFADSYPPPRFVCLGPGETREIRIRWDHWSGVGPHTVEIVVDPENEIEETNEDDNRASKTIKILDKMDLAWGFVRDSTAGAVSFEQAISVPHDWIVTPQTADLGTWSPLRSYLRQVDRGAMILVPLTNFGEIPSDTCSIELTYKREDEDSPFRAPLDFRVGPIDPTDTNASGKKFPILLLPDLDHVEIRIDPGKELDEQTRENNTLRFKVPSYFWDDIPTLKPKRSIPKVIERFQSRE